MKKMQIKKEKPLEVLQKPRAAMPTPENRGTHSRKRPVPKKLGELMEMVNSLPPALPGHDELWNQAREKAERGILVKDAGRDLWLWGAEKDDRPITELEWRVRIFVDAVDRLRPPAKDFIGTLHPQTGMSLAFRALKNMKEFPAHATLAASSNRYDFLFIVRDTLRSIADKWALGNDPEAVIPVEGLRYEETSTALSLKPEEGGRIGRSRSELLEGFFAILNDEDVDFRRILRCPICGKIYWAERYDQPTCSTKCNNNRRSQMLRKTYVEDRPRFQKTKKGK